MNEKYSFKDFIGQDLSGLPASEFNGKGDVVGSCFTQEFIYEDVIPTAGGKKIFPAAMTGVTFSRCNLDNVALPAGNVVTSGQGVNSCQNTIQQTNDLEDWMHEFKAGSWIPKIPVRSKEFIELGLSIDPADIPAEKAEKSVTTVAREA